MLVLDSPSLSSYRSVVHRPLTLEDLHRVVSSLLEPEGLAAILNHQRFAVGDSVGVATPLAVRPDDDTIKVNVLWLSVY